MKGMSIQELINKEGDLLLKRAVHEGWEKKDFDTEFIKLLKHILRINEETK